MRITLAPCFLLLTCAGALAQTVAPAASSSAATATPAPPASITTLQAVTVTGVVPGPGLWKVSRGDHVLWIMGMVRTVPSGIEWRSAQVAQTIAASQVVLEAPGVKTKLDTNWLGKLFLLPSVYHAQRNPDGKTLQQVLPPALYARWASARQQYLADDRGVERLKPMFAGFKLYSAALKQHGLRSSGKINDTIKQLAEQHQVKLEKPRYTLEVHEPRQAVKTFEASGLDGTACLNQILDVVEHRLPALRASADAWATGDIATLRKVRQADTDDSCESAFNTIIAKSVGVTDLSRRLESTWLTAADTALASHTQSFAVLPMDNLLDPHGYLAALQARGYTVIAPDAEDASTTDPAAAASTAAAAASSTH
ncbi:MAG: TraB/GumN family protein [Rhodanobacteraceae bacterium]|nr:MAG: TraB/GumN family protein [Rhodanobacteraceae bacterium]